MTLRRARCVLAAATTSVGLALAGAPAAEALSITPRCSPAPENCSAWYHENVELTWDVRDGTPVAGSCQTMTYQVDTAGTIASCEAVDATGTNTTLVKQTIRRDATLPLVTGSAPGRAADANGWYNHAVKVTFTGADQTSGIDECSTVTYSGPDTAAASVMGSCTDRAGNRSAPLAHPQFKYDETGPEITDVLPERPPDFAGWFNHPVRFDVFGTDAMSGLADCPPLLYSGPDGRAALVSAACLDRAANKATRTLGLPFDGTAPVLAGLKAAAGDGRIDVSWRPVFDAESVEVVRTPGFASAAESLVFSGRGRGFRDGRVTNGARYSYRVRLVDEAGNASTGSAAAVAGPRLIAPGPRARRRAGRPPLLRWTPVRRANYYNVQLFRGGRKVLSVWPAKPRYRLKRNWTYGGRLHRLSKGTYRWYVWPGYGDRSDRRFGKLIGHRALRIG